MTPPYAILATVVTRTTRTRVEKLTKIVAYGAFDEIVCTAPLRPTFLVKQLGKGQPQLDLYPQSFKPKLISVLAKLSEMLTMSPWPSVTNVLTVQGVSRTSSRNLPLIVGPSGAVQTVSSKAP